MALSERAQIGMRGELRLALADYPELNEMVDGEVLGDDHYRLALERAVQDWNITPPMIGDVTLDTLEGFKGESLIYMRASVDLLRTEFVYRLRNAVDISDGGASINNTNKSQLLLSYANSLRDEYEQKKLELKVSLNLSGAWGGVESAYSYQYSGGA